MSLVPRSLLPSSDQQIRQQRNYRTLVLILPKQTTILEMRPKEVLRDFYGLYDRDGLNLHMLCVMIRILRLERDPTRLLRTF
jgi:hypothetical protein